MASCKRTVVASVMALVFCVTTAQGGQLVYLASTQAKNIVAYDLDEKSGKLAKRFVVDLPGNAGPMTFSPDGKKIYAAMTGLENRKAGVATLQRAADGTLKLLHTCFIKSRAPYIQVDPSGRFLLAAHYGAGEVTMYAIKDGVCTGKLLDQHVTAKTAHCIELDPSGRFVFVPHTQPNRVYQFRLDKESGKLKPNNPPYVAGPDTDHRYHAPRHYAHHPTLKMAYTSNEAGGGISAWSFDDRKGTLTRVQTLSTLPPGYEGGSAAADIRITPNGRFAYVSNRDTAKRAGGKQRDTLAGVAIDAKSGKMKVIGHYPTAAFPRSFCIDLKGRFVFAAGQRDASLVAYRIAEDGSLKRLATYKTDGTPIWVMCGEIK